MLMHISMLAQPKMREVCVHRSVSARTHSCIECQLHSQTSLQLQG
jgi:hypothetical protein